MDLLNEATKAGYIKIGNELKIEDINDFSTSYKLIEKKQFMQGMKEWEKKNIPTVNTNGLRIKELYDLNSKEFNLKEEEGISSRVKKIWMY